MDYHSFPFVKLCRIFQDESLLKEYGISQEDWQRVKEGFLEAHPSEEETVLVDAYKAAVKSSIELNKNIAVMRYILSINKDWKPYFEAANIKYTGNAEKDSKYLQKQIQKLETKAQVFEARLKKIQEEIKESKERNENKPITTKQAYKALAGLEKAGAHIPDFETFTCGKYDAWNEVIKEANKKNG